MATYFHGNSQIQASGDGLQTLIFMNPAYVGCSDSQPPSAISSNFGFFNPSSSGNTPHAPPSQSLHFVAFPFHGVTTSADTNHHDVSSAALQLQGFLPRVPYNACNQAMDLEAPREVTRAQQGLSLRLSSEQPPSGYGSFRLEREVTAQPLVLTAVSQLPENDVKVSGGSTSPTSGVSNGGNGLQSVILSSKYLKATQELLDEVVKVGIGAKGTAGEQPKKTGESAAATAASVGVPELSTAERQQMQMKKAKLIKCLMRLSKDTGSIITRCRW